MQRRNAERAEQFGLADAGQFQKLRRIDRAPGDDHLARRPRLALRTGNRISYADAALAFQDQRLRHRSLLDDEVLPSPHRIEVTDRGALALATGNGDLRHADAFLGLAILVRIE